MRELRRTLKDAGLNVSSESDGWCEGVDLIRIGIESVDVDLGVENGAATLVMVSTAEEESIGIMPGICDALLSTYDAVSGLGDTLGARVKSFRQLREFTQGGLAAKCGIHVNSLSNIERGLADPKLGSVQAIADALGISLRELIPARHAG